MPLEIGITNPNAVYAVSQLHQRYFLSQFSTPSDRMKKNLALIFLLCLGSLDSAWGQNFTDSLRAVALTAQHSMSVKPRILISTDIGGTDPDDFQSMIHFLMYSDLFKTEGLVSSPFFGHGSKQDILKLIDLYEKDLPKLKVHSKDYPSPDALRAIYKQGRHGATPLAGYMTATEGSDWIIKCAKKKDDQPLWILVWGGLDDLAQALHDAPEVQNKIKVYWIGGPNKKWSANSYAYIAKNFPKLWIIEVNASYRGFFSNNGISDSLSNKNYFVTYIRGVGYLEKDFERHYGGSLKMGDSLSTIHHEW